MSKRFMDTAIWERPEFQNLEVKHKIFWFYLTSKCSKAGIWEPNFKLASYLLGETYTAEEILKVFGTYIEVLENNKWFLSSFIPFQYGFIREDYNHHLSILRELKNEGLQKNIEVLLKQSRGQEL